MDNDETRKRILKVATKIFGKYGFQKTTMDEIARAAHKAKGSVYYYFPSKDDLFRAVVEQEISIIKSGLTKVIINGGDATNMITNYMITRMNLLKDAVNYHETLKADFTSGFESLSDVREEFLKYEVEILKAMLEKGVKENKFQIRDTEATANVILMAMKAIEIPFYLQNKINEYEPTIVELLEILMRGLEKG